MWPFARRKKSSLPGPASANTVAGPVGMAEVAEYVKARMVLMKDLVARRRTAIPPDVPAIDEEMDRICLEVAADLQNSGHGHGHLPGMSKRLRLMVELTLEELRDLRDTARPAPYVDG